MKRRGSMFFWVVLVSLLLHGAGIAYLLVSAGGAAPLARDPNEKPVVARLVRLGVPRDPKQMPVREATSPDPAESLPTHPTTPPPTPKAASKPEPKPEPRATPAAPAPPAPTPSKTTSSPSPPAPRPRPAGTPPTIVPRSPSSSGSTAGSTPRSRAQTRQKLAAAFDEFEQSGRAPEGKSDGDRRGNSATASEGEAYFGELVAKTYQYFTVAVTTSAEERKRLTTVVVVYIGARGELLRPPTLQTPSRDPQFDANFLEALKKAAPFGPPPKSLERALRTTGIAFRAIPSEETR